MTTIIMKQTRAGSNDGFRVESFYKDKTYEVSPSLAYYFIGRDWAVEDVFSSIKNAILENNNDKYHTLRNYWNQCEADKILNSDLSEEQKIELLALIKTN